MNITSVRKHLQAFDVEAITKRFYDRFKTEHARFLTTIEPKTLAAGDRIWYTSVMLNRLMFLYFVQKKGFLAGDEHYLRNRLKTVQAQHGSNKFFTFYRHFLMHVFHDGPGQPTHSPELQALIGDVPYLNGGLFAEYVIERRCREQGIEIQIEDTAFERVFAFFDDYDWHLDNRSRKVGNEINPDVLGFIFEKYINFNEVGQKENGAYYTKEDITGYLSRSTILPYLLDTAREKCRIAFEDEGSVWRLLKDNPDKYIFPAMKHGMELPLPSDIEAGIANVSKRGGWNRPAPSGEDAIALPTEIWRETVARRQRCADLRAKLASGAVESVNDLITYNLDIQQFVADIIAEYWGADLIQALWQAIKNVRVLDPAVGCGAFLFAALNILEPLYEQCLERIESFVGDVDRAGGANGDTKYKAFRDELTYVNAPQHPNRAYFITKSIIVNNLYGVDIMTEAMEICKLRLYLKLVAHVEPDPAKPNMGVEPLPIVDCNIRAGNTLVGYVNGADMDRLQTMTGQLLLERDPTLAYNMREYNVLLTDLLRRQQLGPPTPQEISEEQVAWARIMREVENPDWPSTAKSNPSLNNDLMNLHKRMGQLALTVSQADFIASHTPVHWFVEFPHVMAAGGFDVIIGNPPYVPRKELTGKYTVFGFATQDCPDIYANVVERAEQLGKSNSRVGMIVPLSLTFSGQFRSLRSQLEKYGANWFSSYDNVPAALFSGVSQRCTIWVGQRLTASQPENMTAPMRRWRADFRAHLMPTLTYTVCAPGQAGLSEIPKFATAMQATVYAALTKTPTAPFTATGDNMAKLGYSKSGRNYITTFLAEPPCLDADTLKQEPSAQIGWLPASDHQEALRYLALTSGELHFWYWLVCGNGFNVTGRMVEGFLRQFRRDSSSEMALIADLGGLLHRRRFEALQFKKNAGKYVGSYNYGSLSPVTRRSDLLACSILGLGRAEVMEILDYVVRVLAINEHAGEKAIPRVIKQMYVPGVYDTAEQQILFGRADEKIVEHYGFTNEELDFILNGNIKYGMSRRNARGKE